MGLLSGEPALWRQSEERERLLAEAIFPGLVWQDGGPMPRDPALQGYLGGIVTALTRVSERPDLAVDFTLHSGSLPDAWALSAHAAASRGLVTALADEAEFAFIMGREVAHLAARHVSGRYTPALLGRQALGVGARPDGTPAQRDLRVLGELVLGVEAPGGGLHLVFDADQEREADRLGVLYMVRAGYDPAQAARALERLGRSTARYRQVVPDGPRREVVSHATRAREIDAFVRQLQPAKMACCRAAGRDEGAPGDRWRQHTAGLHQLAPAYAAYDRAMTAFRDGAAGDAEGALAQAMRLGDQAPFWTLLGALRITQGRLAEAEAAFDRALVRFPGYQPAFQGLGLAAFADGRFAVAAGHFRESLRLRPGFAPAEYVLGLSLAALGQHAAAVAYLRAASQSNRSHPEVHGVLARALEKAGQRREAVAAWQVQLRVAPDSPLGLEGRQRLSAIAAGESGSDSRAARANGRFAEHPD